MALDKVAIAASGVTGPIGSIKFPLALARICLACIGLVTALNVLGAFVLTYQAGLILAVFLAALIGLVSLAPAPLFQNINYLDARRRTWVSRQKTLLVACLIATWATSIISLHHFVFDRDAGPVHASNEYRPIWARSESKLRQRLSEIQYDRSVSAHDCIHGYRNAGYSCRKWIGYVWSEWDTERYLSRYASSESEPDTFWVQLYLAGYIFSGLALALGTYSLPSASEGYYQQIAESKPEAPKMDEPPLPPVGIIALPGDPLVDGLAQFTRDCIRWEAGKKAEIGYLFRLYRSYCDWKGLPPYENTNTFSQKWSATLGENKVVRHKSEDRVLVGLEPQDTGIVQDIIARMKTDQEA